MRVAMLGTGLMGGAIARRLATSGLTVTAWNRSREKADALGDAGVTACATPAEAVAGVDLVCLCLTDSAAIERLLFGEHGLATLLGGERVVIDFSTCGPEASRRFAAAVGADWLDCPVSGGTEAAEAGQLAIFFGGTDAARARAEPVLSRLAARVTTMGGVGAGQVAKLCNQLIVSATLGAIAEALALGERLGMDPELLPAAFTGGFADSPPLRLLGPAMAARTEPARRVGAIATMRKDVVLCSDAACSVGLALPLLDAVAAAYLRAEAAELDGADLSALIGPYRDAAA